MTSKLRISYKALRSLLFSAIIIVGAVFGGLYVLLAVPYVQRSIADVAEKELSTFLGGKVTIGDVSIFPFNEVVLKDVSLQTPEHQECLNVSRLGAGINLWRLLIDRKIEITYAEIIGLDGKINKATPDGKLNIQFLIDAFTPKDKNKPPAQFDLKIHNIVIRRSAVSYDNLYAPRKSGKGFDANHIQIKKFNADILLPRLSNNDIQIDVRRISLALSSGFELKTLRFKAAITDKQASLSDFCIELPHSRLRLNDQTLHYDNIMNLKDALADSPHNVRFEECLIVPSDLSAFLPALDGMNSTWKINLDSDLDGENLILNDLKIFGPNDRFELNTSLSIAGIKTPAEASFDIRKLNLQFNGASLKNILQNLLPTNPRIPALLEKAGNVKLSLTGAGDLEAGIGKGNLALESAIGDLYLDTSLKMPGGWKDCIHKIILAGSIETKSLMIQDFLEKIPVNNLTMTAEYDVAMLNRNPVGDITVDINSVMWNNRLIENLHLVAEKIDDHLNFDVTCNDAELNFSISGESDVAGENSNISLAAEIDQVDCALFDLKHKLPPYTLSGNLNLNLHGSNLDNLIGEVNLDQFNITGVSKSLKLDSMDINITSDTGNQLRRNLKLTSDWFDLTGEVSMPVKEIVPQFLGLLSESVPLTNQFLDHHKLKENIVEDDLYSRGVKLEMLVKPSKNLYDFLKLPVVPLIESSLSVKLDDNIKSASVSAFFPFLLQGTNKLIRQTSLTSELSAEKNTAQVNIHTIYPTKKGDLELDVDLGAKDDLIDALFSFNKSSKEGFFGNLKLDTQLIKSPATGKEGVQISFDESHLGLNGAEWTVSPSTIKFCDNVLEVNNFKVFHNDQYVLINGVGSSLPDDEIMVDLADVDLDYIFDTLNINYVSFGGTATGEVFARGLFTTSPEIHTRKLSVKNLSYNGGVLGDGDLSSKFDLKEKKVSIFADIKKGEKRKAIVDGGIWITRDSLAFDLEADKVDIAFLKPFMQAFSSEVKGRASGKATLYGTFSDIDLVGRLFADTISMKVDYTNVTYSGSDSVIMTPGRIIIPGIRLYDRYGNSGLFSGEVRHRYFHEPTFEFNLREADNLLCYDTDSRMNNIWYGRVFGTGSGYLRGDDSLVAMDIDMTTQQNSDFTFVLTDMQDAGEYKFLKFTDKRREEIEKAKEAEEPDFLTQFKRKYETKESGETVIAMDLRATITPEATLNLIMDPVSGDKIKANGAGSMQMEYNSSSDELKMYGKYILDQGHYHFSLQDIILRDFTIRPGSSISFNGDPMNGLLDIAATYRVNTNLSDLDKSFTTDRDLNRTNVPVDAVLLVDGPMTSPDITFDIDLPTLTDEVERKVRSIISTDDQMSRQIIYLLALNRFYTPEYMGNNSNGGEWASVASSTISSQLSNMLGQLTDKVSVMPSIRSDKGDFSDMEVDLALSSKLLNNRLLLNGNFGYRDKATSSTTFVGDFDIEYILTRNGTLRLKAYNHFNDENYYLKSALTTQGVGIVVRKDFNGLNLKNMFRRRKSEEAEPVPTSEIPDKSNLK